MATQKPISSISYNSEAFLKEKLNGWYKAHIIQAYQYICHKGEDGDKDHIHFRVEPNKKLDPMDLQEELKEYVIGQEKPLGVRPFRPSVEEDWFLYAVHDQDYLRYKYSGGDIGEKMPYKMTDIKVSDGYDLQVAFVRAQAKMKHSNANLGKRLMSGEKPIDLIQQGENVFTINAISKALYSDSYGRLVRENEDLRYKLNALIDELNNKYELLVTFNEANQVDIQESPFKD